MRRHDRFGRVERDAHLNGEGLGIKQRGGDVLGARARYRRALMAAEAVTSLA